MHSVDSILDRFCRKHPNFGIPRLMNIVVVGTIIVYLLDLFSSNTCSYLLAFSPALILKGQIWRLVTFVFVPMQSNIILLAISLYFYWMIGTSLEREWGSGKFTIFYCFGVLLNIILGFFLGTATMAYVNYSMFFSFATLFPDMRFLLFFFIPIKAKWLAWLDAALFAYSVISYLVQGYFFFALVPIIAILNYFLFFSGDILRMFRRLKRKADPTVINFKKAQKQAQKKAKETKGYMHKCAVCGITDADDPNMEFRYCSKCNGYYCYCANHIHNHVHIQ